MSRKKTVAELAPNVAVPVGEFVEEFCVKPEFDQDGVQVGSAIGRDGKEYPDPVPMSAPLGYEPPVPLMDMMRAMVERLREPQNDFDITESEEEAEDFDVEDDFIDPLTPYEAVFNGTKSAVKVKSEEKVEASSKEAPVVAAPVVSESAVLKPT